MEPFQPPFLASKILGCYIDKISTPITRSVVMTDGTAIMFCVDCFLVTFINLIHVIPKLHALYLATKTITKCYTGVISCLKKIRVL